MNFKELLESNKIEKLTNKQEPIFNQSFRDLEVAKKLFLSKDYEWALNITYNAVLRAGREVMFALGYRPIGKEHHKNVFEFLKKLKLNQDLVDYFNRIRIKRNNSLYGDEEDISKEVVEETLNKANKFVLEIRTFVLEIRTE